MMKSKTNSKPLMPDLQPLNLSQLSVPRLLPETIKQVMSFGFVAKEYILHLEKRCAGLRQLNNAKARKQAAALRKRMRKLRHLDAVVDEKYYRLTKTNRPEIRERIRRNLADHEYKLNQRLLSYGFGRESLMVSIVVARAAARKIAAALADEKYEELATLQMLVRMPLDEFRQICRGLPDLSKN